MRARRGPAVAARAIPGEPAHFVDPPESVVAQTIERLARVDEVVRQRVWWWPFAGPLVKPSWHRDRGQCGPYLAVLIDSRLTLDGVARVELYRWARRREYADGWHDIGWHPMVRGVWIEDEAARLIAGALKEMDR